MNKTVNTNMCSQTHLLERTSFKST